MLAVPQYLMARNVVSAKIQGGALANSSVTWGTAVDLALSAGTLMSFKALEFSSNPSSEMLMPSDSTVANYQLAYDDFDATLREIVPANGTGAILGIVSSYDYIRYDLVYKDRGAALAAGTRIVVVGVRSTSPWQVSQGENVAAVTIKPCGYGIWVGAASATPPI